MTIKAIETRYKGYRFRSRLEARWAVFFDALGIPWEYEKEGFELPSGPYLPDFYLPSDKLWVEIKGEQPNGQELSLARDLANCSKKHVFIFNGLPCVNLGLGFVVDTWNGTDPLEIWKGVSISRIQSKPGYFPAHRVAFITPDCNDPCGQEVFRDEDDEPVFNAASMARSARFEHGQSGAT